MSEQAETDDISFRPKVMGRHLVLECHPKVRLRVDGEGESWRSEWIDQAQCQFLGKQLEYISRGKMAHRARMAWSNCVFELTVLRDELVCAGTLVGTNGSVEFSIPRLQAELLGAMLRQLRKGRIS